MGFEEDIAKTNTQLVRGVNRIVGKIAFAVLSTVVRATPVGNATLWKRPKSAPPGYVGGRARGNWQVGLNHTNDRETGSRDKEGNGTIDKGAAVIGQGVLGKKVIIFNNVPYIVRLNMGHSRQAPAGFVEKATQEALNAFTDNQQHVFRS